MEMVVVPFLQITAVLIDLYFWVVMISVVLSWLTAFKVINTSNKFVYLVMDFTHRATEPALRPIRRFIPNLGGIDISPVLLILLLMFLKNVLMQMAYRMSAGG